MEDLKTGNPAYNTSALNTQRPSFVHDNAEKEVDGTKRAVITTRKDLTRIVISHYGGGVAWWLGSPARSDRLDSFHCFQIQGQAL